jgi:hypothetical protein
MKVLMNGRTQCYNLGMMQPKNSTFQLFTLLNKNIPLILDLKLFLEINIKIILHPHQKALHSTFGLKEMECTKT